MRALRFEDKKLTLKKIRLPDPTGNEALISVTYAGICATDLEILKGYLNFSGTLGHEFVGVVEKCDGMPELENKRVGGEINAGCGYCRLCQQGMQRHCPDRTVLGIAGRDGAFAEYLVLPTWNLHRVPDEVDDRAAVFAEPLAAAFEIPEQVHLVPNVPVLVIGDGRLAQLIVRVLDRLGCQVEVVGKSESKVRRMKGHAHKGYLNTPPPGVRYPVVVEASGSPTGWKHAVKAVEPRGTLVLKSTYVGGGLNFNPAPLVIDEVTVVGSRCGRFPAALRALKDGLQVTDLIDAEFPLSKWEEAFAKSSSQDTLKVLFALEDAAV